MAKLYGNNAHNGNAQLKESMKKRCRHGKAPKQ